ncbi:MAG: hypothetical protein ACR2F6_15350 [Mycobacteriales bacterium]
MDELLGLVDVGVVDRAGLLVTLEALPAVVVGAERVGAEELLDCDDSGGSGSLV